MWKRRPEQKRDDSPYCAFKNDQQRLWALVSRDIRLIVIAVVVCSGPPITWRLLMLLLR